MDLGGSNRSQLDQKSVLVTRMTKGSDAAAREMGSIAKSTNAMGTRPEKKSALTHPHASKIWSARFSLRFSAVADHAFPEPQPLIFPRLF
jgi:hypothetical protein